ncbi:pitrilysin [Orbus sturtevantii]|uniref:pitrilysin n=1 Tax=Orbus sturtevantii TaxID=3074109 RepID=UPI00370DC8CD
MKKYYLVIITAFICLLSALSSVNANENTHQNYTILTDSINKSERDKRQYQVIRLDNNMKVLLISDPKAAKSLASLAIPIGSLYDPKSQQGLAHYAEHMVLMGSKKYPEPSAFSEYLSLHSGSYNASTANHRTAFYFEVENSALASALDRLADAIAEPLLDEKYADKERNAVDAELTIARSSDGFRIGQVDSETINQNHPASMFSGGNLATLSDKEGSKLHDELVKFHHTYYSAGNMVGVIYSNQPLSVLANLAAETFGRIDDNHRETKSITEPAITADNVGKMIYMQPAQPKKVLYLQFPIENNVAQFADKSDEYISYLISNRSANTLFDKLQKQGLIESVSANSDPLRYGTSGVFSIYVSLTDQGLAEKDKVIASIFSYLQLLEQKGIDSKYYNELKAVLALEFKYPDITRDMSYVEWLADQMLLYPTEHVLDADYIAEDFNQQSIKDRLKSLTIDNARIWVIADNQVTDKRAYFVDAPYRIDSITAKQSQDLMEQAAKLSFELPLLNPYIANDFTIEDTKASNGQSNNIFNPHGNYFHFNSEYFADEPKAVIALSLRNNFALNNAKNQVMFNLLDYLANRELAILNFQASVAGMSISTQADSGLMVIASGFNQHLPNIVNQVLNTYSGFDISDEGLVLAKSWYLEKLDAAERVKSFTLAMQPVNVLSAVPYFDREVKREVVAAITVDDLAQYRKKLRVDSVPYMLSIGNLSSPLSYGLYNEVKKTLNSDITYQPTTEITISNKSNAIISQNTASTDNALLMGFVPKSYDKVTSRVASYLLYQIISPWFYDQLRSNEQLGYAIFSLPISIGNSNGIGFLIQSNQYDPAYINQRYQAFYPLALNRLNGLTDEEFEQYKQSALDQLLAPPQTLDEEFANYLVDYRQSLFNFASKKQKIDRLKIMTKVELVDFYRVAVIEPNGLTIASQVIGSQPDKTMSGVQGLTEYKGAADLQRKLLAN